jgi:hypothetical protein
VIQSAALAHALTVLADLDRRRLATADPEQVAWIDSRADWWSETAAQLAVELTEPAGVV